MARDKEEAARLKLGFRKEKRWHNEIKIQYQNAKKENILMKFW